MRRKFIVAHNFRQADMYVRRENFRINDFRIVTEAYRTLRGHDPKNMHFVFLKDWQMSVKAQDVLIINDYQHRGATSEDIDF